MENLLLETRPKRGAESGIEIEILIRQRFEFEFVVLSDLLGTQPIDANAE